MKRALVRLAGVVGSCFYVVLPTVAQESIPSLVKRIEPGVVTITTYTATGEPFRTGTGFFIDRRRLLATNAHVVSGAFSAEIKSKDGEVLPVSGVAAVDKNWDIAVLAVGPGDCNCSVLDLAATIPDVGERVFAIGSPFGLAQTLTDGLISSIRKNDVGEEYIQLSVPVSPGSSGSPVVNLRGEVVGMVASRMEQGQNINFAIPSGRLIGLPKGAIQSLSDLSEAETTYAIQQIKGDGPSGWFDYAHLPQEVEATMYFGIGLLYGDKVQESLPHLTLAATQAPEQALAWYYLYNAYRLLGKTKNSQLTALEAIKRSPAYATDEGSKKEARLTTNELSAIASMKIMGSGSLLYRSVNGEFPESLAVLGKEPMSDTSTIISKELASGVKTGYKFHYRRVGRSTGFEANAEPLEPGVTGRRNFWINENQVIRFSTSRPAAPYSPSLDLTLVDPVDGKRVFRVGNGVSAPAIISRVEPTYSQRAKATGLEGKVVLATIIRKDGGVDILKVVRSLGYGLDENAIQALKQWKFRPGMKSDISVDVALNIEVSFSLERRPKAPAVGTVSEGYRFKGGDPSKPENWEEVPTDSFELAKKGRPLETVSEKPSYLNQLHEGEVLCSDKFIAGALDCVNPPWGVTLWQLKARKELKESLERFGTPEPRGWK
jgi:TonB family protein